MKKSELKSLLRIIKQMRKEGETWEQAAKHLNRDGIRTVRGLRWKKQNLHAWFSTQAINKSP